MVFMYYYLNQTNYPHVAYPTLTDLPELMRADSTVRSAGCGLCSASMVVTNLTGREFSLIDCLELSLAVGANHSPGTDMDLLAPYVAERFDLDLVATDDPELLREHLKRGGMAVANVTGDLPEVHLIVVSAANLNEVNMELTPEVEASIPEVIKVIWGLI